MLYMSVTRWDGVLDGILPSLSDCTPSNLGNSIYKNLPDIQISAHSECSKVLSGIKVSKKVNDIQKKKKQRVKPNPVDQMKQEQKKVLPAHTTKVQSDWKLFKKQQVNAARWVKVLIGDTSEGFVYVYSNDSGFVKLL